MWWEITSQNRINLQDIRKENCILTKQTTNNINNNSDAEIKNFKSHQHICTNYYKRGLRHCVYNDFCASYSYFFYSDLFLKKKKK